MDLSNLISQIRKKAYDTLQGAGNSTARFVNKTNPVLAQPFQQVGKIVRNTPDAPKPIIIAPLIQKTRDATMAAYKFADPRQTPNAVSPQGLQNYGNAIRTGFDAGTYGFGAAKLKPLAMAGGGAVGALLGGALAPKGKRIKGATEGFRAGVDFAPYMTGFLGKTNPAQEALVNRAGAKFINPAAQLAARSGTGLATNVVEGLGLSALQGKNLTDPNTLMMDAAFGAARLPQTAKVKGFGDLYQSDVRTVREGIDYLSNPPKSGKINLDVLQQLEKDAEVFKKAFKMVDKGDAHIWKEMPLLDKYKMIASKMQDLHSSGKTIQLGITDSKVDPTIQGAIKKVEGETVYHGGSVKRDALDFTKAGSKEQGFGAKAGMWFTKDKGTAQGYGKEVMETKLNLKNPKTIDAEGKMYGDMRDIIDEQIPLAKKQGHDGVIIKNLSDEKDWGNYKPTDHYVVFDPKSLKPKGGKQMTAEQVIETAGGWKPGTRQAFDTALFMKDKQKLTELLPTAPQEYKERFAKEINDVMGGGMQKAQGPYSSLVGDAPSGASKVEIPNRVDQTFNTNKFNLSEENQASLKELQKTLGLDMREIQSFDDVRRIADELGTEPYKLLKDIKNNRITASEVTALGDIINTSSKRIEDLSNQLKADPTNNVLKAKLNSEEALLERAVKQRIKGGTEAGRAVVAYKQLANKTLDPAYWLDKAKRQIGEEELDAEVTNAITTLIKNQDRMGLARFIATLGESSGMEKAITMWKAGLLTSLRTHEANIISNTGMGVLETVKDLPATAFDMARAKIRGTPRTKTFSLAQIRNQAGGAKKGFKMAREYMKEGIDPNEASKMEIFKPTRFGDTPAGRVSQLYTDAVFKALGAEDKVFREIAVSRSIAEQAALKGINEGLTTDQIKGLIKNPTKEMQEAAVKDALYATFTKENRLSDAIRAAKSAGGGGVRTAIDVVMPFVRTPTNVAEAVFDYLPTGFAKTTVKKILNGSSVSDKELAESFGRSTTGTGLVMLGVALAQAGKLTGNAPASEAERAQSELENKPSGSIFINGKWLKLGRISPLGNLLSLGAEMQKNGFDVSQTTFAAIKNLTDQTFLKGVASATQALTDPTRNAENFTSNLVSGYVPTIISDAARSVDDVERKAKGWQQGVMARVPWLRGNLNPRYNSLGDEVKREGGTVGRFVGQFVDVFDSKTPSNDPFVKEMSRVGYNLNYAGDTLNKKKLTQQQQSEYQKLAGKYIKELVPPLLDSSEYRNADIDTQHDIIEKAVNKAKSKAREELKEKLPELNEPNPSIFGSFISGADAAEVKPVESPKNVIDKLKLVIQGSQVDPGNTIKAIFTTEVIRKVEGDAVIFERKEGLSKYSGEGQDTDHIIPLSIGGDNSDANLRPMNMQEKNAKTRLEQELAKKLASGDISKQDAQREIQKYIKDNHIVSPTVEQMKKSGQSTITIKKETPRTDEAKKQTIQIKSPPSNNLVFQARVDSKSPKTIKKDALKIYDNEKLTPQQKREEFKKLGTNESDVEFMVIDSLPNTQKAGVLSKILTEREYKSDKVNTFIDRDILTSGVVDSMVEQKLLNEGAGDSLKAYIKAYNSSKKGKTAKKGGKAKFPKIKIAKARTPKTLKISFGKEKKLKPLNIKISKMKIGKPNLKNSALKIKPLKVT